ncbi:hypothetical protein NLI96_g13301 [Meripilus lineatus]|uniref:Uncharacterized protein n=1 Tax=Meripilus lineatus TaxID=2056292 RepID=A0AAD5UNC2_9APHY|nr:hypothetical protein NLI96_g13301 [Physisporinus lineatus]
MKPLMMDFYNAVGVVMKATASAIATVVVGFEQVSEVIATTAMVTYYATSGQFKMAYDSAKVGYENLKKQGEGYSQFMRKLWSDTTAPDAHLPGQTGTNQINFAKGENGAHPKAYHDDAATRFLQQLRDQAAELQSQLTTTDKLTNAERELAKFNQQISDWKDKTLTADQKSLIAHQAEIRAQLQKNIELEKEVKHREAVTKLQERSAQIQASIASYQQSQRDQYSRQLDAIGMGSEAVKNAQAVKEIYAKYQHEKEQLDKNTAPDLLNSDKYKYAVAQIQTGLQQSCRTMTNTTPR